MGPVEATHPGWVESNPRAPGYDPVRVGQVLDLPVSAIYEREPRDPGWAPGMESQQRTLLAAELGNVFEGAAVDEVECRTGTCRSVVRVRAGDLDALLQYVQVFVPLGEVVSFDVLESGSETARVAWYLSFGPRFRDLTALAEHVRGTKPDFEKARARWIEQRRQQGEE